LKSLFKTSTSLKGCTNVTWGTAPLPSGKAQNLMIFHSPIRQLADWDYWNPQRKDGRAFTP